MRSYLFLSGVVYSIGWLICVISGASGYSLIPWLASVAVVVCELAYLRNREWNIFAVDVVLLLYGITLGWLMEIFFLASGIVRYATENALFSNCPPAWVWSLYFLFIPTVNHSLKFLNRNFFYPLCFGLFGAPLAYFAAASLGAVMVDNLSGYLILSLLWAVYLVLVLELNQRLKSLAELIFNSSNLSKTLTVFYDSVCPVCLREITHLRQRRMTGKVKFFDLASQEDFEKKEPRIDYLDAMREIHAIDSMGTIFKGTRAFSELYARVDLPVPALMLRAPVFSWVLRKGYAIWAKRRLRNRCKIQPLK